jgi:hypothetical protein
MHRRSQLEWRDNRPADALIFSVVKNLAYNGVRYAKRKSCFLIRFELPVTALSALIGSV